jgi:hypothetical protein
MPREGERLDARSESPRELLELLDRYLAAWAEYLDAVLAAE